VQPIMLSFSRDRKINSRPIEEAVECWLYISDFFIDQSREKQHCNGEHICSSVNLGGCSIGSYIVVSQDRFVLFTTISQAPLSSKRSSIYSTVSNVKTPLLSTTIIGSLSESQIFLFSCLVPFRRSALVPLLHFEKQLRKCLLNDTL
jgi:hypothetical protein